MRNYMFLVTIRVDHEGQPFETKLVKCGRAESDHLARRQVLCRLLDKGRQVVSIESYVNKTDKDLP